MYGVLYQDPNTVAAQQAVLQQQQQQYAQQQQAAMYQQQYAQQQQAAMYQQQYAQQQQQQAAYAQQQQQAAMYQQTASYQQAMYQQPTYPQQPQYAHPQSQQHFASPASYHQAPPSAPMVMQAQAPPAVSIAPPPIAHSHSAPIVHTQHQPQSQPQQPPQLTKQMQHLSIDPLAFIPPDPVLVVSPGQSPASFHAPPSHSQSQPQLPPPLHRQQTPQISFSAPAVSPQPQPSVVHRPPPRVPSQQVSPRNRQSSSFQATGGPPLGGSSGGKALPTPPEAVDVVHIPDSIYVPQTSESSPNAQQQNRGGRGVFRPFSAGIDKMAGFVHNIDAKKPATFPEPHTRILDDPFMLMEIYEMNEVLAIPGVNVHAVEDGEFKLVDQGQTLTFHRTNIPEVALLKVGELFLLLSLAERPSLRPYRNYYLLGVQSRYFFALETPHNLHEEELAKLECMFYYYTRFVRQQGVRPGDETKVSHSMCAKPLSAVAGVIEGGSKGLAKIFVLTGTGIAKGAQSTSEFYCKHRAAYKGPSGLTEEQQKKLERKSSTSVSGAVETGTEGMAKGTGNVVLGVKKGFRYAGEKVSGAANAAKKPVTDSDWYKKREEKKKKKKEEEDAKGIRKEAGVASAMGDVVMSGWNGFLTVKDGVEKGMVTAGTGIRDAAVEKERYRHGDYAAELSKQRWNSVGNVGVTFSNMLSILKLTATIWMKAALYTATGVVAYDADLPNKLAGPGWKEGWVMLRRSIEVGVGWKSYWAVLRTHLLVFYESPAHCAQDCEKIVDNIKIKFNQLRTVRAESEVVAGKKYAILVETSKKILYLSTLCDDLAFPPDWTRNPQEELDSWVSSMATLSMFQISERSRKRREKEKEKQKQQAQMPKYQVYPSPSS